jgi:hypothetical protein
MPILSTVLPLILRSFRRDLPVFDYGHPPPFPLQSFDEIVLAREEGGLRLMRFETPVRLGNLIIVFLALLLLFALSVLGNSMPWIPERIARFVT